LTPQPASRLNRAVEQLGVLRAEVVYRFHMQQAERFRAKDEPTKALRHYNSIRSFLAQTGPPVSQVKAWYEEADELGKELSGLIDGSAPAA